jgi:hypothetical protein
MKYKLFVVALLLCVKSVFSYSLILINDSVFRLSAIVQGSNSTFLGEIDLVPGQQQRWDSEALSAEVFSSGVSLTPFTVIWRCPNGSLFSICSTISPGSTVPASGCPGNKFCSAVPSEQQQNNQQQQQPQQ